VAATGQIPRPPPGRSGDRHRADPTVPWRQSDHVQGVRAVPPRQRPLAPWADSPS